MWDVAHVVTSGHLPVRHSLPQQGQSGPVERIQRGGASERGHHQFRCPSSDFLSFPPGSVDVSGVQPKASQSSPRHKAERQRAGQEVQRRGCQLRIGFEGKSKRDSDVAAVGQDFGQPSRCCLRRGPPVLVISQIAQTCRDLSSWHLRAAARQFIDYPSQTPTAQAKQDRPDGAIGQSAHQMGRHRLYIPTRAQALRRQLRLIQAVNQIRNTTTLQRYSGMDLIAVHPPRIKPRVAALCWPLCETGSDHSHLSRNETGVSVGAPLQKGGSCWASTQSATACSLHRWIAVVGCVHDVSSALGRGPRFPHLLDASRRKTLIDAGLDLADDELSAALRSPHRMWQGPSAL
jgi:hypothetical protein